MNKVIDIGARSRRLDTASRWVARMDRGLTDSETAELEQWLAAEPENARVLLSLTQRWDKMESLSRLADLFPANGERRPASAFAPLRLAAAAALLLIAATVFLWYPRSQVAIDQSGTTLPATADTFVTWIGEQASHTLADGSILELNTNSEASVEFTRNARVLRLARGEIHVKVAKDASRPFSVIAADRILQAVGTAFSVQITDDQTVDLTVTEGRVLFGVTNSTDSMVIAPIVLAQSQANTIEAGEEIRLGKSDESAQQLSAEDIEVKLSWRQGRLIFRGEPLEAALAEVERYTTVHFVFLEDDLRTREVVGRFRAGDVDGLLLALRLNFNIGNERVDDNEVLLSSL